MRASYENGSSGRPYGDWAASREGVGELQLELRYAPPPVVPRECESPTRELVLLLRGNPEWSLAAPAGDVDVVSRETYLSAAGSQTLSCICHCIAFCMRLCVTDATVRFGGIAPVWAFAAGRSVSSVQDMGHGPRFWCGRGRLSGLELGRIVVDMRMDAS